MRVFEIFYKLGSLGIFTTAIILTLVGIFAPRFLHGKVLGRNVVVYLLDYLISRYFPVAWGSGTDLKNLDYSEEEIKQIDRRIRITGFLDSCTFMKIRLAFLTFLCAFFLDFLLIIIFPEFLNLRDIIYIFLGSAGLVGTVFNIFYLKRYDEV
jgi:hypothetical protein